MMTTADFKSNKTKIMYYLEFNKPLVIKMFTYELWVMTMLYIIYIIVYLQQSCVSFIKPLSLLSVRDIKMIY